MFSKAYKSSIVHSGPPLKQSVGHFVQPKLEINQPGDAYEVEADAMADKVLRVTDRQTSSKRVTGIIGASVHRKCAECEEEETNKTLMRKADGGGYKASSSLVSKLNSSKGGGAPLPSPTRNFMENAFSTDFSNVRVHNGGEAAEMSKGISAKAFTHGSDIYFNNGAYQPETQEGKHLLAHELTHVLQQGGNKLTPSIQMYSNCSSAQDGSISADHSLAMSMLGVAISKVRSYNGTTPPEVKSALAKHFHGATSNAFAVWINVNLKFLLGIVEDSYACFDNGGIESIWACGGSDLATTFWCVPGVNIRLCPIYFGQSPVQRATTLIHEWVHKYGCNFDLGYEWEGAYSGNSTITQLLNADSFANFIKDVQ